MFRIDSKTNRIAKLKEVRFSDLGFGERTHLQEWIANQPDALGEELLIIQKEFAGFDDTKERLDLLALDKNGGLVIIENKLDDSGRDVVWQCLKYASYCSTLSKTSVAQIYQEYLDRNGGGDAKAKICEFLREEDFEEANLNAGVDQRLVMVAAQFRKEVTSTALWLLRRGLRVQCFRATPFQLGSETLLNLEQIIPLPEAEELMIGIAEKEKEESSTEQGLARRHTLRLAFWDKALDALEEAGVDLYSNISPGKDHWLNAGSGLSGVHYTIVFQQRVARVEFIMDARSPELNKRRFEFLKQRRKELETSFGGELEWRRMDDRKASIISYEREFDGYDQKNWPEMIAWLVDGVRRFEKTFGPMVDQLRSV